MKVFTIQEPVKHIELDNGSTMRLNELIEWIEDIFDTEYPPDTATAPINADKVMLQYLEDKGVFRRVKSGHELACGPNTEEFLEELYELLDEDEDVS